MTDHARRPLLFLDVDGPLLPFGGNPQPGSRRPADVPHLARLRPDTGLRLAALPCTLVWATTWQEDANTEIAPRIGLPDLPVVTWPEPTEAHEREDRWFGLCWKIQVPADVQSVRFRLRVFGRPGADGRERLLQGLA